MQPQLSISTQHRLGFQEVAHEDTHEALRRDVGFGLTIQPKRIPSLYFYDRAGSRLFEEITGLPEYYLTRSEQQILDEYSDSIVNSMQGPIELVEFGSGSSKKTRTLIEAALENQDALTYTPIDISSDFLLSTAEGLVSSYLDLTVHAIAAEYAAGLLTLPAPTLPRMFLFMGSSIGNLDRQEALGFLRLIRHICRPEDRLLLGADLIKDLSIVQAAYNDSEGVTEAFNKNLLVRINRELRADCEVSAFRHEAPFLPLESYVEMRLVSLQDQVVSIGELGLEIPFPEGETIVTEHCAKYSTDALRDIAIESGFRVARFWFDEPSWFTLALFEPVPA